VSASGGGAAATRDGRSGNGALRYGAPYGRARLCIGVALVAGTAVYLTLHRLHWAGIVAAWTAPDLSYALAIAVALGLFHLSGGLGLWVLVGRPGPRPWATLGVYSKSLAVGFWTPMAFGDASLAWLLWRRGIAPEASVAAIAVDKLITLAITALAAGPVLWLRWPRGTPPGFSLVTSAALGAGLLLLVVWLVAGTRPDRSGEAGRRFAWTAYVAAARSLALRHPGRLGVNCAFTVLRTVAAGAAFWFCIASFAGGRTAPFALFVVLFSAARLMAFALPTPNGLGVFEAALLELLIPFGVPAEAVLLGALLARAMSWVLVLAAALTAFAHETRPLETADPDAFGLHAGLLGTGAPSIPPTSFIGPTPRKARSEELHGGGR